MYNIEGIPITLTNVAIVTISTKRNIESIYVVEKG